MVVKYLFNLYLIQHREFLILKRLHLVSDVSRMKHSYYKSKKTEGKLTMMTINTQITVACISLARYSR